jgi:D-3-phosphoglycerate dehydrogenase
MPLKVLLLEGVHEKGVAMLRSLDYSVETMTSALGEQDLIDKLVGDGIHILGIRSKTRVTERVISAARGSLVAIGCFCIGTNQVALAAANAAAIPVFNSPFSNTRSVAELALCQIIALNRQLTECTAAMHAGKWSKSATGCHEIRGKCCAIIGFGHVGSQLGILCEAMGMSVVYYDVVPKLSHGNMRAVGTMAEAFQLGDVVTVHVPETPETQGMVRAEHFALMRKGAKFLNLARGTVVDLDALAAALRSGHLGGAAVDVFPIEPESNGPGFVTPLQGLKNVILTPHIAGSTVEAQSAIGEEVSVALHRFAMQGTTLGAVNFPHVAPLPSSICHRIINVHRNVPGVLLAISKIIAERNANVSAQVLATDENIGVVVLDFKVADESFANEVHERICQLPVHIKSRLVQPHLRRPNADMLRNMKTSDSGSELAVA